MMCMCEIKWALGSITKNKAREGSESPATTTTTTKSLQSCPTLCDPIDGSPPGPCQSLGFSRQEHWSGLPFPSPMH